VTAARHKQPRLLSLYLFVYSASRDRSAEAPADDAGDGASELATLTKLVGDLERRLTAEVGRRAAVEKRLEQWSCFDSSQILVRRAGATAARSGA